MSDKCPRCDEEFADCRCAWDRYGPDKVRALAVKCLRAHFGREPKEMEIAAFEAGWNVGFGRGVKDERR